MPTTIKNGTRSVAATIERHIGVCLLLLRGEIKVNQQQNQPPNFQSAGNLTPVPGGAGTYEKTEMDWEQLGNLESETFQLQTQVDRNAFIQRFNAEPYSVLAEARACGMGLSAYSNIVCAPKWGDYMHMFQRIALENGFLLDSNPRAGYWASKLEDMMGPIGNPNPAGNVLVHAYINDVHRQVFFYVPTWARKRTRSQFDDEAGQVSRSDEHLPGSYDLPWHDSMMVRLSQILDMQIPLEMLTSRTENIRGVDYREVEIEQTHGARSLPVDQGDDFPLRKISLRDQYTRLHKRGLAVQVTDEVKRRTRIDRIGEEFAISMTNDKIAMVYEACAVIFNGDENDGTAAVKYDPYELDKDGDFKNEGKPTFRMWRNWKSKVKFESPYRIDCIFGDMQTNTDLVSLRLSDTADPVFLSQDYVNNPNVDRFMPMPADAMTVYYFDVDTSLIENMNKEDSVAYNKMFGGVTYLSEIGGTYTEQERRALSQSDLIISSMVYGMAKRQKGKCASYVSYDGDRYPAKDYPNSPWNSDE